MTKRTIKRSVKKKTDTKVDGRTREGRALKEAMQRRKKKRVKKAPEARVKRKYTQRGKPKSAVQAKFTQEELEKAKAYFNSARSQVRDTVKQALQQVPKPQWNPTTHIVDGSMKVFNTLAVAEVLGI
jgi:hypothetical protein